MFGVTKWNNMTNIIREIDIFTANAELKILVQDKGSL